MSEIKNSGLDQCGAEPFEWQQFGTAVVEAVRREASIFVHSTAVQLLAAVAASYVIVDNNSVM